MNVKEKETYEFKFNRYGNTKEISDSMKSIFQNTEIVSIIRTEKVGLDQIQDAIK